MSFVNNAALLLTMTAKKYNSKKSCEDDQDDNDVGYGWQLDEL